MKVSLCQLKKDPAAYDRKLLHVTGFFTHGFEDFTLFDPTCSVGTDIWLEYGGKISSGTIYCCGGDGKRTRRKSLVVEDMPIPLIADQLFRDFDRIVQKQPSVVGHVTLVGHFFAGESPSPGVVTLRGYGHLGCCALLAIQQVLAVDPQTRPDLDYAGYPNLPGETKVGCTYDDHVPSDAYPSLIAAQEEAERSANEWFFEPEKATATALAHLLDVDSVPVEGLKQVRKSQGRIFYEWRSERREGTYRVVASRPYWLSFFAKDPQRVAWVVIAAWEVSCQ